MGFVKFDRKIKEWGWYTDIKTFKVFFHLILTANYTDKEFLGKVIKRGQVTTSVKKLAEDTGLTADEVRTAVKHLLSTGEVTSESQGKYTLYTVINYDTYQDSSQGVAEKIPKSSPRLTHSFPSIQENKELKESQESQESQETIIFGEDDEDEIKGWGRGGVVKLSERQFGDLLDRLGIHLFDEYFDRVVCCAEEGTIEPSGHYELIRRWAAEDRRNNGN